MARTLQVYYDEDISAAPLAGAAVTVLGYGGQGRAQALNLKDEGFAVTVGLRAASASRARAAGDGFPVALPGEAVAAAKVAVVLVPDEVQGGFFARDVAPALRPETLVVFAHGGAVTAGDIKPPENVDVVLVAPMGPGHLLREYYTAGEGLNAKVAVARDASGEAWLRALAYARALGCGRAGVIATTFAEETRLDLFSEQAVLCGGVPALAEAAFQTLVEAGYPPALAYIECVREIKYIADLMFAYGVEGMRRRVSSTALYGGGTRGPQIVGKETRRVLRGILKTIENGSFASEMKKYFPGREELLKSLRNEQLEGAAEEIRALTRKRKPDLPE